MNDIERELLRTLPHIPRDENGPLFSEPWEAQAFGMAVHLNETGLFTWAQWAKIFSQELAKDGPNSVYYLCWLSALEKILCEQDVLKQDEIILRKEAWARAALHTPHGQPIELQK